MSPSTWQRIGTMCSRPLLAPIVWTSSIGGGSGYGAATSPPFARNSAITSAFVSATFAIAGPFLGAGVAR
jgi:Na+/glutamate symporter